MALGPIAQSFAGIDNKSRPEDLGAAWFSRDRAAVPLREAVNVDLTDTGGVERRQGFSLLTANIQHSLWVSPSGTTCLGYGDGQLRSLATDLVTTSDLLAVADKPLAFCECSNGVIYFSNGQIVGKYDGTTAAEIAKAGTYERSSYKIDQSEEAVYYDGPPAGFILEWAFGRLWVVDADGVWHSQGFEPEKFDRENDYIAWPDVTMFKAVDGGFYLGTAESVQFLPGGNPKGWASGRRQVSNSGAVLGTAILAKQEAGRTSSAPGCMWESVTGAKLFGSPDGQVAELSADTVSWPTGSRGASIILDRLGRTQHVTVFPQDEERDNNFRTSDFAVAEIRRNGVII